MMGRLKHLTQRNWRLALFAFVAGVLVASQALSVVHSAKYGDGPHEHNGAICVVSILAKGGEKLLGAATFVFALILGAWAISLAAPPRVYQRITVRAARPRGPPHQ